MIVYLERSVPEPRLNTYIRERFFVGVVYSYLFRRLELKNLPP